MLRRHLPAIVLGLACWTLCCQEAAAVERHQVTIGLSTGPGWLRCDGCPKGDGVALAFDFGYMLSERVAVVFDLNSVGPETGTDDVDNVGYGVGGLGIRYWPTGRIWVEGCGGLAVLGLNTDPWYKVGLGVLASAGVEMLQRKHFVLDLGAHVATGTLTGGKASSLSVNLGVNWSW